VTDGVGNITSVDAFAEQDTFNTTLSRCVIRPQLWWSIDQPHRSSPSSPQRFEMC